MCGWWLGGDWPSGFYPCQARSVAAADQTVPSHVVDGGSVKYQRLIEWPGDMAMEGSGFSRGYGRLHTEDALLLLPAQRMELCVQWGGWSDSSHAKSTKLFY